MSKPHLIKIKIYLDDGCIENYCVDTSGKKQGYYIKRYKNRKAALVMNFIDNIPNGECISFFPDNSIQYKTHYLAGKRHGNFKQWDKKKKLIHHLIYKNGVVMDIPYSIAKEV